jgi:hypothetical protein
VNRFSASLRTIEVDAAPNGTHLILTEQAAFLDGYDDAGSREVGTAALLASLTAYLVAG